MSEPTINGILRHLIGQCDILESVCRNYGTHRTEFARGQIAELKGTITLVEALRNRVEWEIAQANYAMMTTALRDVLGAQEDEDE